MFATVALGFAAFAIWGDNDPIKGPIPHKAFNWFDSFIALVLYALLLFNSFKKYYVHFGYALIYLLNLGNIYLLYGTSFNEQYAYQFIVVYAISGWFFRHESLYYLHTAIINVALIITSLLSEHGTQSSFDFYGTYIIAALAQSVLIRYRFGVEDKMRESEARYRLLAENSRDLICIHNTDGTIAYASPSYFRLLGYSPEETIGAQPYRVVHPNDKPIIRLINITEPDHPSMQYPIQYRIKDKKGNYVWMETILKTFYDKETGAEKVLSQSRDIRRSKGYQEELEQRSKELERSNADLETFAFVSSHDMKEPLRMISNYMQLLKKRYGGKLDKEADEYIEFANRGAVTLQQLIHDLLSYSRLTRAEIKKSNVSVAKVVNEAMNNMEISLREKNATVKYEGDCTVTTDVSLLVLVIQNLIENGIKYNRSGNPLVQITDTKRDNEIVICVKDNGMGMAPEHQQRIFEPFHRLHTKAEIPGTGLGLSICKRIVDRLGGRIWVESSLGNGSSFYISFPA